MKITRTQVRISPRRTKGFTLIELLVVISIVGLLSSVVMAATASARKNSNDAVVKEELVQLRNLYEMIYTDSGGYGALQPALANQPWAKCSVYSTTNSGYFCQMKSIPLAHCSLVFAHDTLTNSPEAISLCNNIIKNSGFLEIAVLSDTDITKHWSIIGYLPGANQYICFGDSKQNSKFTTGGAFPSTDGATVEMSPGCPGNP